MQLVSTHRQMSFALLTPVFSPPRTSSIADAPTRALVDSILNAHPSGDVLALDLETCGTDPTLDSFFIVGVALSNSRGNWYLNTQHLPDIQSYLFSELLRLQIPLIGHNLFFDAACIYGAMGQSDWLNWRHCTLALYRYLATEGFPGQKWGLKSAQRDLLGWSETNELALDNWLVSNGYGREVKSSKTGETELRPLKSEMWRAPTEILGHYAALDTCSTYSLYTKVLLPVLKKFPVLEEYAGEIYLKYLQIHIRQRFSGIRIDREELSVHHKLLSDDIVEKGGQFQEHPAIVSAIARHDDGVISKHLEKEPARYLIKKLGKEPARLKKNGDPNTNYEKWLAKSQVPPMESKNWTRWNQQLAELRGRSHFNWNSSHHKRWIFYEALGNPTIILTKSGLPGTGGKALRGFGEIGRLLIMRNKSVKELEYVDAVIERSTLGVLHPSFLVPGTLTGRLSGAGGLNVQQQPKSERYLKCWKARPGMKWVQVDFTALEQVVLAELSRDPALWKLYGPAAKKNDVYLFTGAFLPVIGKKIRDAGYDPDNPTEEGIASAKKLAKKERGIAKVITLASSYGAGAKKIRQTLQLEGIPISLDECYRIHAGYWELYAGIKEYEKELLRQYNNNDGWVLNGIGRPIGLSVEKEKDIINQVVQSTGHDILVLWLTIYTRMLEEAGISHTHIIADLHDESIIEVREEDAAAALLIMEETSMKELNACLRGKIQLRGAGMIADSFADIKIE